MRIVMLSDQETVGGAGVAASRLAAGLLGQGHEVTRIVGFPDGRAQAWQTMPLAPERPARHMVLSRLIPSPSRRVYSRRTIQKRLDALLGEMKPDVVNVHNLHAAAPQGWSPELVRVCAAHAPVVWTLHDMWSFTGRCAHARGCQKFTTGCDETCPTPGEYPQLPPRLIADAWNERRSLFTDVPGLTAVTPSCWLASEAARGFWKGHRVEVIPNGLDLHVFEPLDRQVARQALGIQAEGPVLLMVSAWLDDPAKGGSRLVEAIASVKHRPLTLVTLGEGSLSAKLPEVRHQALGRMDHARSLALAYNAADLFVHPSPAENLPNVIVEALACGTPTAAFPVGGIPELVETGATGWLADDVSASALARAVNQALDAMADGTDTRAACRAEAEARFGIPRMVERYLELFSSLTAS